mgnify:CR=1 FL=1
MTDLVEGRTPPEAVRAVPDFDPAEGRRLYERDQAVGDDFWHDRHYEWREWVERHADALLSAAEERDQAVRERDDLLNEKKARSAIDPVTRLHNLCDALAESRGESPYDQESWDLADESNRLLQAERDREKGRADALQAEVERLKARYEPVGRPRPMAGMID